MPIITISLNNRDYQLSCSEESKKSLQNLADKINQKIINIKQNNNLATPELLLAMNSLMMQAEIDELNQRLLKLSNANVNINQDNSDNYRKIIEDFENYLQLMIKKIT